MVADNRSINRSKINCDIVVDNRSINSCDMVVDNRRHELL
jgi:hypothetical protein